MGMLERWTLSVAVLFIHGCSSEQPPAPPTVPPKTVFDPLTQPMDQARGVQSTVDRSADNTQKAIEAQERGDASP